MHQYVTSGGNCGIGSGGAGKGSGSGRGTGSGRGSGTGSVTGYGSGSGSGCGSGIIGSGGSSGGFVCDLKFLFIFSLYSRSDVLGNWILISMTCGLPRLPGKCGHDNCALFSLV